MSVGKGGERSTSASSTSVDPQTQQRMQAMWDTAGKAGEAGPSPLVNGATDFYKQMMHGGNLGMGFLSGDPNARSALMDPYQSQVIDANNAQWQRTNQQSMNAVNDVATKAGAFGGSRHGVATGTALAANNLAQQQQTAGLLSSGFNSTADRAMGMANMGYGAAGQNANLGMGGVGSPEQWKLMMQRLGYMGPSGSTTNTASAKVGGNAQGEPLKFFQDGGFGQFQGGGGPGYQGGVYKPGGATGPSPTGGPMTSYPGKYY